MATESTATEVLDFSEQLPDVDENELKMSENQIHGMQKDDEFLNDQIISEYKQLIDKEIIEKMIIEKSSSIEMKKEFFEQLFDGKFVKALKMIVFKEFQKPYSGVKMSEKRFQWFGSTTYHCFLVSDLIDWIGTQLHLNEKDSMIFVNIMNVLGWIGHAQSSNSTTISKNDTFKILQKPKLVLIGGGMSGYKICKSILNEIFDLTVIDKEGTLDLVPIYPTIISDKNNVNHISVDHKKTLPETVSCVKGIATNVTKFGVVFETKEIINDNEDVRKLSKRENTYFIRYDYLVVGPGCTCWNELPISNDSQIKFVNTYSADSLVESHEFISNAKEHADEICVVGGGYVGVEVAGFLAEKYQKKNITLIQRSDILMRPSTEAHKSVSEIYKTMGNVKVLLKSQVVAQKDPYTFTVRTKSESGEETESNLSFSVCFICTGMKPQTDFMESTFSKCLDEKGFVKVNPSMQVLDENGKPYNHIFAIGDATNVKETKLATCAHKHAKTVYQALPQIIQSISQDSIPTYKPRGYEQLQGVIIGPNNGLWIKGNSVLLNSKAIAWMKESGQAAKGRRMNKL